jgi:hypothetical protein
VERDDPLAFTENSAEAESKLLALVDQCGKNSGLQLKDLKPRVRKDSKKGDRMELTALGEGGWNRLRDFFTNSKPPPRRWRSRVRDYLE